MDHPRSSRHVNYSILFVILVCGLIAYGAVLTKDQLIPFFMARAYLNSVILGLCALGFVLSFWDLIRLSRQASQMVKATNTILQENPGPGAEDVTDVVNNLSGGLVRNRCLRTLHALIHSPSVAAEAAGVLSDADAEAEEGRGAFVRYLIGVMVFLGLIGTFWGLLITVSGVKEVLQALEPSQVDDVTAFVTQLKSSIAGLLGGMSTAFSTSLFGLGASVVLGFVDVQTRQAKSRVLADLDRFIVTTLIPEVDRANGAGVGGPTAVAVATVAGSGNDRIYYQTLQETMGNTLAKLTETLSVQSGKDERLAAELREVRGILESIREQGTQAREEVRQGNESRRSIVAKTETVGRNMERLVTEMRTSRDSSHEVGAAVKQQVRLAGELTDKTIARGFENLARKLEEIRGSLTTTPDTDEES